MITLVNTRTMAVGSKNVSLRAPKVSLKIVLNAETNQPENTASPATPPRRTAKDCASLERGIWPFSLACCSRRSVGCSVFSCPSDSAIRALPSLFR